MIKITSLDHVQLAMPEGAEKRIEEFYVRILGLSVIRKPYPLSERGGIWFAGDSFVIHYGVEKDFQPARKAHIALTISNYGELRSIIQADGGVVIDDNALPDRKRFYSEDPVGNRLEFISEGDGFRQKP